MDAERFDRVAKSLAAMLSRRRLVGGLAAVAAVGSTPLGAGRAGAQGIPGLPDGSEVTTQATDPRCRGERAINNVACPRNRCTDSPGCFCTETVRGNKKCVSLRDARCPARAQCNRNTDCGSGEACVKVGGCCGQGDRNLCAPICG
jgi:hypothetical protein